jgi:hypothetical protein
MNMDDWSIGNALKLLKSRFPRKPDIQLRKALVGMLSKGAIDAYAEDYREGVFRIDDATDDWMFGDRNLGNKTDEVIPQDFWRIEHATGKCMDYVWAEGWFTVERTILPLQAPHRFFKVSGFTENEPRYRLKQSARNVTVDLRQLDASTQDSRWPTIWSRVFESDKGKRGRPTQHDWNGALANFIVNHFTPRAPLRQVDIVSTLKSYFDFAARPDETEMYRVAKIICDEFESLKRFQDAPYDQ